MSGVVRYQRFCIRGFVSGVGLDWVGYQEVSQSQSVTRGSRVRVR